MITGKTIPHRSALRDLIELALKINDQTMHRTSVINDGKARCFKVIVYVNDEAESKIATYKNSIYYDELLNKADECRKRLEYFLSEGRVV